MGGRPQCAALVALSPSNTLYERRCTQAAGEWYFEGHYGVRRLCDSHAKSYRETGYELQKG